MSARRATLTDVAAEAGVSVATVSLILNGRGTFPESTRERVRAVAERLQYSPNVRALKLRNSSSNAVALVTALPRRMLGDPERLAYFRELALPTAESAMARGYSLTLVPPLEDLAMLETLDVDGVVVVDPAPDSAVVRVFNRRHLPVVTIGAVRGIAAVSMVDRGVWGADALVDHMLEQGLRHLLLVYVDAAASLDSVLFPYLERRAQEDGFRFSHRRVPAVADRAGLEAVASEVLADPDGPDAVYSPWSFVAGQLMEIMIRRGVRVPDDVMFATNFDSPGYRALRPAMTTMDLHLHEVATLAAEQLMQHLRGVEVPARVPAPSPRILPRESSLRRPH